MKAAHVAQRAIIKQDSSACPPPQMSHLFFFCHTEGLSEARGDFGVEHCQALHTVEYYIRLYLGLVLCLLGQIQYDSQVL